MDDLANLPGENIFGTGREGHKLVTAVTEGHTGSEGHKLVNKFILRKT